MTSLIAAGDAGSRFVTSQLQARLKRGCDRCGAPFADIATLPSGQELQFCAHHASESAKALAKAGATWQYGNHESPIPIAVASRYLGSPGRVIQINGPGSTGDDEGDEEN